jgi:hypothetical protein
MLMLPLKNVSQGWLCTIGFGGFGHDWKCSGTIHAGMYPLGSGRLALISMLEIAV